MHAMEYLLKYASVKNYQHRALCDKVVAEIKRCIFDSHNGTLNHMRGGASNPRAFALSKGFRYTAIRIVH